MTTFARFSFALALGLTLAACDADDDLGGTGGASATTSADGGTGGSDDAAIDPHAQVEAHIEVIRQRIAANNAQDWDTWESLHTPDAVRTSPDLDAPLVGAPALRAGIEELFVTFPNYHLELVEAFGEGDRLMARIHTRATMEGPLDLGDFVVPPTGKSFEQDWVAVLTFEGGRISAIDEFYDNYGTMVQLGLAQ